MSYTQQIFIFLPWAISTVGKHLHICYYNVVDNYTLLKMKMYLKRQSSKQFSAQVEENNANVLRGA